MSKDNKAANQVYVERLEKKLTVVVKNSIDSVIKGIAKGMSKDDIIPPAQTKCKNAVATQMNNFLHQEQFREAFVGVDIAYNEETKQFRVAASQLNPTTYFEGEKVVRTPSVEELENRAKQLNNALSDLNKQIDTDLNAAYDSFMNAGDNKQQYTKEAIENRKNAREDPIKKKNMTVGIALTATAYILELGALGGMIAMFVKGHELFERAKQVLGQVGLTMDNNLRAYYDWSQQSFKSDFYRADVGVQDAVRHAIDLMHQSDPLEIAVGIGIPFILIALGVSFLIYRGYEAKTEHEILKTNKEDFEQTKKAIYDELVNKAAAAIEQSTTTGQPLHYPQLLEGNGSATVITNLCNKMLSVAKRCQEIAAECQSTEQLVNLR